MSFFFFERVVYLCLPTALLSLSLYIYIEREREKKEEGSIRTQVARYERFGGARAKGPSSFFFFFLGLWFVYIIICISIPSFASH